MGLALAVSAVLSAAVDRRLSRIGATLAVIGAALVAYGFWRAPQPLTIDSVPLAFVRIVALLRN